jgi:two-component system, OmpR family, sensor histidine kinase KdpD
VTEAATGSTPRRPARHQVAIWLAALIALGALTALLFGLRPRLDKVHIALVYLLVVLGGSAAAGRALGVTLSVLAFLLFNFLFLSPFHTLVVADPFDWLVLLAFLVTGIVAAELLSRAHAEAETARRRAAEVDRLAALGAETLGVARAEDALAAIVRVIRSTLDVDRCEVYTWDAATARLASAAHADGRGTRELGQPAAVPELVRWVATHGREAAELVDGTTRLAAADDLGATSLDAPDVCVRLIPLEARGRTVGVLRLEDPGTLTLDPTRHRYLDALAYYAALGVERARLAADAERVEALREADRLKDSLLAAVSHDLRTPLTTIRGLAHDMAAGGDERALVIEEEVDRLNRFVADLLDLSRLNAGGVPTSLALNAAEDVMGAALQRVVGVAHGREIRASLDPSAPVLVGRFDFAHTLRILANVLENALKYAPHDAPIDFTVRQDGETLAFAVADRGPGVPEPERERIFAPFYRPPGSPPDIGGAGLGLAIARGLAEAQGGALTHAPREGGGSIFTLRLPAAELGDAILAEHDG